ncbi:hypothetical protein CBS63078_10543 [Aspergillus niger]|nr:hypothetical protein CBS63078_10543 [Aspergillus niger]KAI3015514.1 hypothetical protein CBS147347_11168 [Aspergillus niger]
MGCCPAERLADRAVGVLAGSVDCPTHIAASLGRRLGRELPWLLQTIDIATALEASLVGVLLGANIVLLLVSAHSLLHGAITIARADNPIPSMRYDWVALLGAAAILMMIPVTLHAVVRRHCQVAMRIHYFLTVTAMVALVYHTWDQGPESRWQVVGAGALWIVLSVVAVFHADSVQQRWRVLDGPPVPPSAHPAGAPFYVAYWDDAPGPRILYVLTRPRASSLSTRLYLRERLHQRRQPALLLGPYGRSIDFSLFGTIVFVVEDIGMLRVLPYIRMLVQASEQRRAMVRKLKIVWQMQDFDHQCWLGDWMQDLLDLDRGELKILGFRLYYLRKGTSINPGEGFGERIKLRPGPMVAREVAQGHLSKRRGKLAVGGRCDSLRSIYA